MTKTHSSIALPLMIMLFGACSNEKEVTGNETTMYIKSRCDIRTFEETPVPREEMEYIISCGLTAPNYMNTQPWEIRVVDNPDLLAQMSECMLSDFDSIRIRQIKSRPTYRNIFKNAPTVAFIGYKDTGYGEIDCGMLGANMIIAAQSMGYGSCVLGYPVRFLKSERGQEYFKRLSFSPGYKLLYAIAFGTPKAYPEIRPVEENKYMYIE